MRWHAVILLLLPIYTCRFPLSCIVHVKYVIHYDIRSYPLSAAQS